MAGQKKRSKSRTDGKEGGGCSGNLLDSTVFQNPKVASRIIDGKAAIVSPEDGKLFLLNEVGSFIWKNIEKPATLRSLLEKIRKTYEVGGETAGKDLLEFTEELKEAKILVFEGKKKPAAKHAPKP